MKKKLIIIMNPCAGLRRANKYLTDIIRLFSGYGFENTVYMTEKSGDGVDFCKDHARDADLVVCIGGDGTLNEVISGIISSGERKPIGYIPAGSTNDFANSLKLSKNIMEAAREIMEGVPHTYDVGSFNGRYFSYIASFGAFTKTAYSTIQPAKNVLGHLAYILEGIKEIPNIYPVHLRVQIANQTFEEDYIFGAVSNSTSVAGILTLNPNIVNMNDGKFEIMLIKSPSNIAQLRQIVLALRNQNYDCEMIRFCSADRITIYAPGDLNWTLDGEYEKGNEIIGIKNLHNAIELMMYERQGTT